MNNVLILADPVPGGFGTAVGEGFRARSWQVRTVPFGVVAGRAARASMHRWPSLAVPLRRRLHASLARETPADLAIVVKGPFLTPHDVARIRDRLGAPVLCWNPDDPTDAAISNRGAGIPAAMAAYDAYVTWSPLVARRLAGRARRVLSVPFGWDPSTHFPVATEPTDQVVFVGTRSPEREAWLRAIADLRPTVYGNGWRPIPGVTLRPAVSGARLREVVAGARAVLNFLRPQNAGTHNMRTFEIPGCGGAQVAEHSDEHARMLAEGHLFRDVSELREILERCQLSRPGLTPSWLHAHTYERRVEDLLRQL